MKFRDQLDSIMACFKSLKLVGNKNMTFRDKLKQLNACSGFLEWVGNKTLEQAWETCENSRWMLCLLAKTHFNLIDPVCDIAERVLHLVPEEHQLVCIWAINAARKRADKDELDTAYASIKADANAADAAWNAVAVSVDTAYPASFAAAYAAAYAAAAAAAYSADYNCYFKYYVSYVSSAASYAAYASGNLMEEKKKQCDILRKYFTIDQVREALNKQPLA